MQECCRRAPLPLPAPRAHDRVARSVQKFRECRHRHEVGQVVLDHPGAGVGRKLTEPLRRRQHIGRLVLPAGTTSFFAVLPRGRLSGYRHRRAAQNRLKIPHRTTMLAPAF